MSATRPVGPARSDASLAGAPGLAVVLAALWLLAGPVGLLAGVAVGALWLAVPVVYAVGAGHVLLAAVTAAGTPLPALLPAEAGLVWLLLATGLDLPESPAVVVAGLGAAAVGVGLVAWLAPAGLAWTAAVVLVVFVGVPVGGLALDRLVERIEGGAGG